MRYVAQINCVCYNRYIKLYAELHDKIPYVDFSLVRTNSFLSYSTKLKISAESGMRICAKDIKQQVN